MTETTIKTPVDSRILDIYDRLPASERRIADVILECQGGLASYSASELAERAGVSKATTSRLFRRLGYERFTDARRDARGIGPWGSPLSIDADGGSPTDTHERLSHHLARDVLNLTRTFQSSRPDALDEAARLLINASRVWVVGFRNSHALAHYARGVLSTVKSNVRLVPGSALDIAEELGSLSDRDVVVAIGMRRRLRLFRRLLALVHGRGAPIVMITDPTASTATRYATVVIRCHNWGSSRYDSYAAAISVLNFLCSHVAAELGPQALEHLETIEDLHVELDDLITTPGEPSA